MQTSMIIIGALLLIYFISIYNRLIAIKNNVMQSWANIDLLLKQVHQEIPKLVEICKQFMSYEQELLEKITKLRAQAEMERLENRLDQLSGTENELNLATNTLFARAEAYPELKTDASFNQLASRISTLQDSITDRKEFYNEAVKINNTRRDQIPEILVSRIIGFRAFEFYQVADQFKKDIDLKGLFGKN